MGLLIDGYNLLWGGGTSLRPAPRSSHAPTPLARAREALLELLVDLIPPGRRKRTQIVFDAANAPVGLPKVRTFEGVEVIFARDYADADALLEELIERATAPRGLTVVSSDRRVQFAARRRGAIVMDSDRWMRESFAARDAADAAEAGGAHPDGRGKRTAKPKLKPPDPCPADVAGWMSYFRFDAATSEGTIVSESWEVASSKAIPRATSVAPQVVWGSVAPGEGVGSVAADGVDSLEAEWSRRPRDASFDLASERAAAERYAVEREATIEVEAAMEAALGRDGVRLPSGGRNAQRLEKRSSPPAAHVLPGSTAPLRQPAPQPPPPASPPSPLAAPSEPPPIAPPRMKKRATPAPPKSKRPPLLAADDDLPHLTSPQDVVPLPPVGQGGSGSKAHRTSPRPPPRPRAANEKHAAAMDKRRAAGPGPQESFPAEMLDEIARLLAAESPGLPPVEPLPPKKRR